MGAYSAPDWEEHKPDDKDKRRGTGSVVVIALGLVAKAVQAKLRWVWKSSGCIDLFAEKRCREKLH